MGQWLGCKSKPGPPWAAGPGLVLHGRVDQGRWQSCGLEGIISNCACLGRVLLADVQVWVGQRLQWACWSGATSVAGTRVLRAWSGHDKSVPSSRRSLQPPSEEVL